MYCLYRIILYCCTVINQTTVYMLHLFGTLFLFSCHTIYSILFNFIHTMLAGSFSNSNSNKGTANTPKSPMQQSKHFNLYFVFAVITIYNYSLFRFFL